MVGGYCSCWTHSLLNNWSVNLSLFCWHCQIEKPSVCWLCTKECTVKLGTHHKKSPNQEGTPQWLKLRLPCSLVADQSRGDNSVGTIPWHETDLCGLLVCYFWKRAYHGGHVVIILNHKRGEKRRSRSTNYTIRLKQLVLWNNTQISEEDLRTEWHPCWLCSLIVK